MLSRRDRQTIEPYTIHHTILFTSKEDVAELTRVLFGRQKTHKEANCTVVLSIEISSRNLPMMPDERCVRILPAVNLQQGGRPIDGVGSLVLTASEGDAVLCLKTFKDLIDLNSPEKCHGSLSWENESHCSLKVVQFEVDKRIIEVDGETATYPVKLANELRRDLAKEVSYQKIAVGENSFYIATADNKIIKASRDKINSNAICLQEWLQQKTLVKGCPVYNEDGQIVGLVRNKLIGVIWKVEWINVLRSYRESTIKSIFGERFLKYKLRRKGKKPKSCHGQQQGLPAVELQIGNRTIKEAGSLVLTRYKGKYTLSLKTFQHLINLESSEKYYGVMRWQKERRNKTNTIKFEVKKQIIETNGELASFVIKKSGLSLWRKSVLKVTPYQGRNIEGADLSIITKEDVPVKVFLDYDTKCVHGRINRGVVKGCPVYNENMDVVGLVNENVTDSEWDVEWLDSSQRIKKDVIGQKNGKTEITGSQEQADSKGSACQTYVASEVSKASEDQSNRQHEEAYCGATVAEDDIYEDSTEMQETRTCEKICHPQKENCSSSTVEEDEIYKVYTEPYEMLTDDEGMKCKATESIKSVIASLLHSNAKTQLAVLNECAEKEDACTEANKVFKIPDGTLKVPTKPKEKPPKVPERKPVRKASHVCLSANQIYHLVNQTRQLVVQQFRAELQHEIDELKKEIFRSAVNGLGSDDKAAGTLRCDVPDAGSIDSESDEGVCVSEYESIGSNNVKPEERLSSTNKRPRKRRNRRNRRNRRKKAVNKMNDTLEAPVPKCEGDLYTNQDGKDVKFLKDRRKLPSDKDWINFDKDLTIESMNYEVLHELAIDLDGTDWPKLAKQLSVPDSAIKDIRMFQNCDSFPALDFMEELKVRFPDEKLIDFRAKIQKIKRLDGVQFIDSNLAKYIYEPIIDVPRHEIQGLMKILQEKPSKITKTWKNVAHFYDYKTDEIHYIETCLYSNMIQQPTVDLIKYLTTTKPLLPIAEVGLALEALGLMKTSKKLLKCLSKSDNLSS